MFKLRELGHILLVVIILTFVLTINLFLLGKGTYEILLFNFVIIAIVIFVNILGKKLSAYYYEAEIEHKIWMWERFGFTPGAHFQKPLPAGLIFPFLVSFLSLGYIKWLAALEFDVQGTIARASKRHGIYRYADMTDAHIGLIAGAGIVANLLFAIVIYIIGIPELAKLSIYYACFSLVPFGNLDGAKIFFGSAYRVGGREIGLGLPTLWFILFLICMIFLSFTFIP